MGDGSGGAIVMSLGQAQETSVYTMLPKSQQSWTYLIQGWVKSGQNALTKSG